MLRACCLWLLFLVAGAVCAQDGAPATVVPADQVGATAPADAAATQAGDALAAAAPAADPLRERLITWVDGVVRYALAADRVGGVSVAVVKDGEVLLARGYGIAGVQPQRMASERTLFRVGSISKTVTYLAAMQLVEHGRLDLDKPVNDYLPERLHIPDDGWREPVRVRHLLNHTAGFEDSFAGHLFYEDPQQALLLADWLVRDRPRRVRAPESMAVYSNYGVALLGGIVAEVSGVPFEDYVETRILRPLGMRTATFREPYDAALARARGLPAPPPPEVIAELSDGLRWQGGRFERTAYEKVSHGAPAGGMNASAEDMAAWMLALLDPAQMAQARVLDAQTLERMYAVSYRNADGVAAIRHGFIEAPESGYAEAFGHDGSTLRFMSDMLLVPELRLGIHVATNSASGARLRARFARLLLADFFPAAERPAQTPADAAADAARVAGSYLVDRRPQHRSERLLGLLNGLLSVRDAGDGEILVSGAFGGEAARYRAVGGLGFRHIESGQLARFEDTAIGMRFISASGVNGGLRVGGLQDPRWQLLALVLAGLAGLAGVRGAWRRWRAPGPSTPPERTLGAWLLLASLAWVAAWILLLRALLRFLGEESEQALWAYPGWDFSGACWLFVAGSVLAVSALSAAVRAWSRPRRWGFSTHFGFALQLLAFIVGGVAAWALGVLGYSGFS